MIFWIYWLRAMARKNPGNSWIFLDVSWLRAIARKNPGKFLDFPGFFLVLLSHSQEKSRKFLDFSWLRAIARKNPGKFLDFPGFFLVLLSHSQAKSRKFLDFPVFSWIFPTHGSEPVNPGISLDFSWLCLGASKSRVFLFTCIER